MAQWNTVASGSSSGVDATSFVTIASYAHSGGSEEVYKFYIRLSSLDSAASHSIQVKLLEGTAQYYPIDTIEVPSGTTTFYFETNEITLNQDGTYNLQIESSNADDDSISVNYEVIGENMAADNADAVFDEAISGHTDAGSFGEWIAFFTFSGGVLEANPNATGLNALADAVWDELTAGHVTVGTFGLLVADILSDTADILTLGVSLSALGQTNLVDAIWDELQSGHSTVGSFGYNLDARVSQVGGGSAADIADAVWDEVLSGHTDAGSAGLIISDIFTVAQSGDRTSCS